METISENTLLNLTAQYAIYKLRQLVKSESMCFFCTQPKDQPLVTRPMTIQKVDEEGNIWFLSSINSNKNKEINLNNQVQLFYSDSSSFHLVTVNGKATIHTDKKLIHQMWTSYAKVWFKDGVDDVDISLIKIEPDSIHYWDTKNNKAISKTNQLASITNCIGSNIGIEPAVRMN